MSDSSRLVARAGELAVAGLLSSWVAATAASQHPNRAFDRLRRYDRTGTVLANWRFFAPEPAKHDFRVLHRVLNADGTETGWAEATSIRARVWQQSLWFPSRRRDKAINDVCNEIIGCLAVPDLDVTVTPGYRILRDLVRARLKSTLAGDLPAGFQFLVVIDGGHDEESEPEYLLASRFEEWQTRAA